MKKTIDEIADIIKDELRNKKFEFVEKEAFKDFMTDTKDVNSSQSAPLRSAQPAFDARKVKPISTSAKESAVPSVATDISAFGELYHSVTNCSKCELSKSRTNVVFGEGSNKAELMIIGEGPGRDEDEQGRPFVGRSGQLLTKMLAAMGFDRKDVFIANIVKCRPPNNRIPTPDEAKCCIGYLHSQIEIIKPKVLLLLGATPLKYILDKTGITKLHGEWFEFLGIKTIASFHPAYLLRDPNQKKYAWEDLQKIMAFLGKTIPQKTQNSTKISEN